MIVVSLSICISQSTISLSTQPIMSNDAGAVGPTDGTQHVLEMTIEGIHRDDSKPSSSHDGSVQVEKGAVEELTTEVDNELDAFSHEHPFPPMVDAELETQQFTFRAVFVGCILGAVISASKYVIRSTYRLPSVIYADKGAAFILG